MTRTWLRRWGLAGGILGLPSAALAQPQASGIAAYESLLTQGFFVLLLLFLGLVVWEVVENRRSSRSSLDIAKLAAAAAKKQSAAGAPSGSLAQLEAPPTSRPFAPPPPPPPPRQPAASEPLAERASPFAPPPPPPPPPVSEASNPFAVAPPPMDFGGSHSLHAEPTVAFAPSQDAGSSGGWADLLQRVRAGEPEPSAFPVASGPPVTEEESFSAIPPAPASPLASAGDFAGGVATGGLAGSSSEAWEALLKRTTSGESGKAKAPSADVGKISLNSSFALPSEPLASPPAQPSFPPASPGFPSPSGGALGSAPAPAPFGGFGLPANEEPQGGFPAPSSPGAFSLPSSTPTLADPNLGGALGGGFSFPSEPSGEGSPFGGFGGGFSAPPAASGSGGFEAPSFKLPGTAAPADDFSGGRGGFSLPSSGGFALGGSKSLDLGGVGQEAPSSSTLPLSDLFSSKPATGTPAFQLPSGGGSPLDFPPLDSDLPGPGMGRTISLDFAKGGGQQPPPPLPKTEG